MVKTDDEIKRNERVKASLKKSRTEAYNKDLSRMLDEDNVEDFIYNVLETGFADYETIYPVAARELLKTNDPLMISCLTNSVVSEIERAKESVQKMEEVAENMKASWIPSETVFFRALKRIFNESSNLYHSWFRSTNNNKLMDLCRFLEKDMSIQLKVINGDFDYLD